MGKVKNQLVLMVKVPDYPCFTPFIIDYDDIWGAGEVWKAQRWFDFCKMHINVTGRFTKDGCMSLRHIHVSMSRAAETFYHEPASCQRLDYYITHYE